MWLKVLFQPSRVISEPRPGRCIVAGRGGERLRGAQRWPRIKYLRDKERWNLPSWERTDAQAAAVTTRPGLAGDGPYPGSGSRGQWAPGEVSEMSWRCRRTASRLIYVRSLSFSFWKKSTFGSVTRHSLKTLLDVFNLVVTLQIATVLYECQKVPY